MPPPSPEAIRIALELIPFLRNWIRTGLLDWAHVLVGEPGADSATAAEVDFVVRLGPSPRRHARPPSPA